MKLPLLVLALAALGALPTTSTTSGSVTELSLPATLRDAPSRRGARAAAPRSVTHDRRILRSGSGGKKADASGGAGGTVVNSTYWADFRSFQAGDSGGDTICTLVYFVVVACAVFSIAAICRDPWWPPFEERSPGLMIVTCLATVTWSWSMIVIDDHAPAALMCSACRPQFWMAWIRMVWGSGLWLCCLLVRLRAVDRLYIVNHQTEPLWWALRLLKLIIPWAALVSLRLHLSDMQNVNIWTLQLGLCTGYLCYLIWLVASVDRKPERRNEIGDVNITMWMIFIMSVISIWVAAATDLEVTTTAEKALPDYDPADDVQPDAIERRQLVSSLLVMLLLLVHWACTIMPLVVRSCRKNRHAWMESRYEGKSPTSSPSLPGQSAARAALRSRRVCRAVRGVPAEEAEPGAATGGRPR